MVQDAAVGRDASRPARPDAGVRRDAAIDEPTEEDADLPSSDDDTDGAEDTPDATVGMNVDPPPPVDGCDLSGRWLMTERLVTNALGAKQNIYNWYYVELRQQGSALTFTKSLACGAKVVGLQPVIISMDDSKAWPPYMEHTSYAGRTGSSEASAGGCSVKVARDAIVRGATVETYRDLSVPLPTLEEPATDVDPGWEDWDDDGHPGVSMRVSGTITGMLYAVTRTWTEYTGTIESGASTFSLPMLWGQSRTTLGYDGSPLLAQDAGRDGDATQHLAELTRLSADDAGGDDAAKCAAVRELAPTLTPNAMK